MPLLPQDEEFLNDREFKYSVQEMPNETILIIKDYRIADMYDIEKTNVLIKIPHGYPMANLDMFWTFPHIKVKGTNIYPPCAEVFETHLEQSWQRFSRHYLWKPSYNLAKHLNVVKEVLVNGRG